MSHFHCLSMTSLYSEPCRATKRPSVDCTFHLPSLPHFFSCFPINLYSFSFYFTFYCILPHSNVCRCQTITLGLLPPSPMNHLIQDPSLEVTVLRYCNKICKMHTENKNALLPSVALSSLPHTFSLFPFPTNPSPSLSFPLPSPFPPLPVPSPPLPCRTL